MNTPSAWPLDADGDVFRRLEARNFDFTAEYLIDFNVDFEDWPPHPDAIAWLKSRHQEIKVYEPEDDFNGYIQLKIYSRLNYTLVIETQALITRQMQRFSGVCETWGVTQPAP